MPRVSSNKTNVYSKRERNEYRYPPAAGLKRAAMPPSDRTGHISGIGASSEMIRLNCDLRLRAMQNVQRRERYLAS